MLLLDGGPNGGEAFVTMPTTFDVSISIDPSCTFYKYQGVQIAMTMRILRELYRRVGSALMLESYSCRNGKVQYSQRYAYSQVDV